MSEELFNRAGLQVARLVGPAKEGPERRRWQFRTTEIGRQAGPGFAVLRREDVRALAAVLLADTAERPRDEIATPPKPL